MDLSRAGPGSRSKAICVVLSSALVSGCMLQLPEYDAAKVQGQSVSVEHEDISVTLQPLTDPQDVEDYFGVDLLAMGFIPVFASVENRSPSSSFVLSAEDFFIVGVAAGVDEAMEANRDEVGSSRSGMVVTLLFSGAIGSKMISNATVVKHTFIVREWQRTTISPGEVKTGFVYLPVTSGANASVRIRGLQLPVTVIHKRMKPS